MTVTTTANSISYAGNGTTTAFAFPYVFFKPSDLVVTLSTASSGIVLSPPPVVFGVAPYDYSVSGVVTNGEFASGATVTFNTAPAGDTIVAIVRNVPATQEVTLIDNTKFPAQTVNVEFDKLTVLAQQSIGQDRLALHIPAPEFTLNTLAAPSALRRSRVLAWDNIGNLIHSTRTLDEIENLPNPSTPLAGIVNAMAYGAVGDGVADDTAALQAALGTGHAVFLPRGNYRVTDMLSMPYGSGLFGETKHFTKIIVPTTFNLSALGVLRIAQEDGTHRMNEQAGTIKDLTIEFDQPETAVRASVIHYPHAIYAHSAGRYVIDNIRIVRAWSGMWLDGNGSGAWINRIEACCFERTMWMDDHFDCTHIIGVHMWPFGVSEVDFPGLYAVMRDGNTIGIEIGRVDGLFMTDIFAINIPKAIWIHDSLTAGSSAAPSNGNMAQLFLDDSGMFIENGVWNVANLCIGPGPVTATPLIVTGSPLQQAFVNVTGLFQRMLSLHSSGTLETIRVGGVANQNAHLVISGMVSLGFNFDRIHAKCINGGGTGAASLSISNGYFDRQGNTSPVQPTILVTSGRGQFNNLAHSDKGTGTGTFIQMMTNDWHTLEAINPLGWMLIAPNDGAKVSHDSTLLQSYVPVVTAGSGTLTSFTATARYRRHGRYLSIQAQIDISVNGSAAGFLTFSLPPGLQAGSYQTISGSSGSTLQVTIIAGATNFGIQKYDGTYPGGDGFSLRISGDIEIV